MNNFEAIVAEATRLLTKEEQMSHEEAVFFIEQVAIGYNPNYKETEEYKLRVLRKKS